MSKKKVRIEILQEMAIKAFNDAISSVSEREYMDQHELNEEERYIWGTALDEVFNDLEHDFQNSVKNQLAELGIEIDIS